MTTFAIIGCGRIGKRHATIIHEHPEAELVGLVDTADPATLGVEAFGLPVYPTLAALRASGVQPDVVTICTPNGLHAPLALEALDAGCHVVIEKPMALRRRDCEAIIHRALQRGRHVFGVMQNRYSPVIAWLKAVLDEGKLGEIFQVNIACHWNRDDRYYFLPDGQPHPWHGNPALDGGVLFTQFAHFIDILYWLFGDIDHIQSQFHNFTHTHSAPFADSGVVSFRLVEGGGLGSLQFSTTAWDRNFESSLSVLGSKGAIRIGGQYMNQLDHCHVEGLAVPTLPEAAPPNNYGPYQGSAANHHFVIQNVIDTLQGKSSATTNALEGMKVVDIIERIYGAG